MDFDTYTTVVNAGIGKFSVQYQNANNENWTENIGYVDATLNDGGTDTALVANDLYSFAVNSARLINGNFMAAKVTYEMELEGE